MKQMAQRPGIKTTEWWGTFSFIAGLVSAALVAILHTGHIPADSPYYIGMQIVNAVIIAITGGAGYVAVRNYTNKRNELKKQAIQDEDWKD